jgi:hypothetical protein
MKAAILALALLMTSVITYAQAPNSGQWEILATSESNSNTVDGNPLQFITDWTTTSTKSGKTTSTTISAVLANTYTNSGCSASGQPVNFVVTYSSTSKIVVTVDNSQTYTFTATSNGSEASSFSGTFTSSGGGCSQADAGNFTATYYAPLNNTYSGTIESYVNTNTVSVTMTLATNSTNFTVSGSIQASDKSCMADLTINGTAAQQYGTSFVTGDTMIIFASDSNGNVGAFVLTATDQNGNLLSPAWPNQMYVTYDMLAGSCSGDQGTDAPFHIVNYTVASHTPVRIPLHTFAPNRAPLPDVR